MSFTFTCLSALAALVSAWAQPPATAPASATGPTTAPAPAATAEAAPAFRDHALPLDKRVDDLIGRLTLEEKIAQTMMDTPAVPRLGIARYDWWNEALHGVARNGIATVFPQAIALAATWNPALHGEIARTIATEARAKNNEALATQGYSKRYQGLTIWSPNINIFRDPRWGRGQETYGEDPFLTGRFGVAFVRGLQGDDPRHLKTVATLKHFAVHSGPEPERHHFDAVVSERDLRETYLPAFEAGIREGGATSVMSAYNAVNGVPAPASALLIPQVLRGEWGFTGAVVGDVDNVSDMWRQGGHGFSKDAAEASAVAIKNGNDLCSGVTYQGLTEALTRGLVTEADIDVALRRLFALRFRLGEFDPVERVPFRAIPPSANATPENDRLALEAARQSLVLLKNNGTLPWKAAALKTVAVLGPTGADVTALLGNYNGDPRRVVTLVDGLKAKLAPLGVNVLAEPGVPLVKGFRVSGQPFPAGALFTDATRATGGLKGEVFSHEKLDTRRPVVDGTLVSTRTDAQINLQWDEAQPLPGVPIKFATVRWSGVLVPPVSGEFVLGVVAEGSVRLFIDDKPVIDSWRRDPERILSTTLALEKDRAVAVRLEYAQVNPKGRIQLGWIAPGADDSLDKALAAARAADHIVLTLGITPDLEGEEMRVDAEGFRGGDRLTIDLPATQRDLLARVAALKKPTVVVLTTGAALAFDDSQADAVLLAWYYGQRGADAVAEALLGEINPAGRLPITFYRGVDDLPAFTDYAMANRTYRFYTGKPLYAFGHGLSYTRFAYESVSLSAPSVRANNTVLVRTAVKNTGPRDGDEVVQVYATAVTPPVPMPLRQLVGFQRVSLRAGETKTVEITVPADRLRRWDDAADRYVVDPGAYRLAVGPASDQPLQQVELTITPPGNTAIDPMPKDTKWLERHEAFLARAKQGDIDVLFLGDSITDFWAKPAPAGGATLWAERFAPLKAANFGISADRTQHVLWRIAHGELDGISPRAVVLLIGTNNTGLERDLPVARNSVPEAIEGVTAVVAAVRAKLPQAKIILMAIFPRAEKPDDPQRAQVAAINAALAKLADGKHVQLLDIGARFLRPDGTLIADVMPDFLHPNEAGYRIWADALERPLKAILAEPVR